MRLVGLTPDIILDSIVARRPEWWDVLTKVREYVPQYKREIAEYQAAVLYDLVYGLEGQILEIGTAYGYSAAVMAMAAPTARITTLNPKGWEADRAAEHLATFGNVQVVKEHSWDYLAAYAGPTLSLVFVDGSHRLEHVRLDCQWWRWVKAGGFMLFHDYSPEGSGRPTPEAYQGINEMREQLGRDFDVAVIDDRSVGMVGWYRKDGE